jgi:hypothetical protein
MDPCLNRGVANGTVKQKGPVKGETVKDFICEDRKHTPSVTASGSDNFLAEVAALLTVPFQLDNLDTNSSTESAVHNFFAACPWCGMESSHIFVSKGFLRKDEFMCVTCNMRTSKCVKHALCKSATKSTFIWDDSLCIICDEEIQKIGSGEISLGAFIQSFQDAETSKHVEGGGIIESNSVLACQATQSNGCAESFRSPSAFLESGEAAASEQASHTNRCDSLCAADASQPASTPDAPPPLAPNPEQEAGHPCTSDAAAPPPAAAPTHAHAAQGHAAAEGGASRPPCAAAAAPACATQLAASDTRFDRSRGGAAAAAAGEEEPWATVRDVVLNWPGPERADVDAYRELCAHKAWVRRWVVSCAGDEAWAVRSSPAPAVVRKCRLLPFSL